MADGPKVYGNFCREASLHWLLVSKRPLKLLIEALTTVNQQFPRVVARHLQLDRSAALLELHLGYKLLYSETDCELWTQSHVEIFRVNLRYAEILAILFAVK